jgi:hypothetical protein
MTSWAVSFVREQPSFEDITLYQLCYWKVTRIYGLTPEEIKDLPIKPYCTYLYRNKVLVITKVTTQDTPKLVSKELCHHLYRNLKLPTNTVRQSTATSQFNRSPRVAPNTFKQLVIVQKHTLTPTRIIKPPTSSVREVPPRRLP